MKTIKQTCSIEYKFINPSLGPILGNRHIGLIISNGKLLKTYDLQYKDQNKLNELGKPGQKIIIDFLNGRLNKKYKIEYNNQNKPVKIYPINTKNIEGASYIIKILNLLYNKYSWYIIK